MNGNENDIDALLALTTFGGKPYHDTAKALVAERDALKEENNALRSRCKVHQDEVLDRVFEMDALKKRIAELESHPPADRDRELRERLDRITMRHAVQLADAVLAAMRKGEA